MDNASTRRVGVLGGTFDPLHRGHLHVASQVADRLGLDRVLFVPAGSPWQKRGYSSAEDRYMMTVLGVAEDVRFEVSRMELDRAGDSYSADTMAALRRFLGEGTELFLIVGADAAAALATWVRLDELAAVAEVAIASRAGFDLAAPQGLPGSLRLQEVQIDELDVSATKIREQVAAGASIEGSVPAAVARYIAERGLYAAAEEVVDAAG